MRNEYLDRALVVPVLGMPDAAFFGEPGAAEAAEAAGSGQLGAPQSGQA